MLLAAPKQSSPQVMMEIPNEPGEVGIERHGDEIILRPPVRNLRGAFDALAALPDDFCAEGREDLLPQSRKGL